MITNTKVKRLFWDIEVSPNLVLAWRTGFQIDVGWNAIVEERKIICIGYKWEGSSKVTVLRWDKFQNDASMLKAFMPIVNEADEIVHHYGDRFDLPWFKTRCLILGFDPLPSYKTVDTKMWASKYFYFNANNLDYIAQVLGVGKKHKTDYDLWKNIVLHKCKRSLDKMCNYCGNDVVMLEKVYHKLRFCVKPQIHAGVLGGGEKWTCPRDGSKNVTKSKTRVNASGTITHQFKCNDCGGFYTISDQAFKAYQSSKSGRVPTLRRVATKRNGSRNPKR
jgi:hypothetical protein